MKLIHCADLHIGKQVSENPMLEDQVYILNQIVEIVKKEKADGILLAGDIYDRAIAPAEAVMVLSNFLTTLSKMSVDIFMISGNHDSPERISFGRELLKSNEIYIAGEFSEHIECITKEDEYGEINFYLLPFAKPQVMRHYGFEGNTYAGCVQSVLDKLSIDTTKRNVLMTHHFVAGTGLDIEEADSEYPISVGGVDVVDYHGMMDFDYVALGHIHRGQRVGADHIRYAGSPLKYSFSEVLHKKGVVVIELKEKGEVSIHEVPLIPYRDMRAIKGELSELMSDEIVHAANPEDYLQVTLTDKRELVDPIGKLRTVYPNVCHLILEKNIRHDTQIDSISKEMTKRSVMEIFEEFYQKVTDQPLDEESKEAMTQIMEEAGGMEE